MSATRKPSPFLPRERRGFARLAVRGRLHLQGRDSSAEQAPEPDPPLRSFQVDIERCVDEEGNPIHKDPSIDLRPESVLPASRSNECAQQRKSEGQLKNCPQDKSWHSHTGKDCHMAIVRRA